MAFVTGGTEGECRTVQLVQSAVLIGSNKYAPYCFSVRSPAISEGSLTVY